MNRDVVFLKAGGSFITFKDKPVSVNYEALKALAEALRATHKEVSIVLGNGGGSFAHHAVLKHGLENPVKLMVKCQQATRLLNRLIVDYLLLNDIPVTSLQTSAVIGYGKGSLRAFTPPLVNLVGNGVIPVLHGECILTENGSVEIFSTEKVFEVVANILKPSRILLLTDVEGVYTCDPKKCSTPELIKRIDSSNLNAVLESLKSDVSRDATGGMYSKIMSMSELSRKTGAKVIVTSGFNHENVVNAIRGVTPERSTVIEMLEER
ncbi:uridylate kinase [Thermosphaera chiliense]|uniref:Isopentenyl phosphate kinase n=1 Tax=Thermosphaera chiliense TaxID=3402707 RepID=A0A7M1UUY1_9CREN|nr:isopentenyl phosphate kinase [Thermosphaera aggregans]QOR94934.1 uridylate kinase [Thermosphaera aggregans]